MPMAPNRHESSITGPSIIFGDRVPIPIQNEVPNLMHEVRDLIDEVAGLTREVPGPVREVRDLARGVPDFMDEVPDLINVVLGAVHGVSNLADVLRGLIAQLVGLDTSEGRVRT